LYEAIIFLNDRFFKGVNSQKLPSGSHHSVIGSCSNGRNRPHGMLTAPTRVKRAMTANASTTIAL
jgi:hypothetical protein